MGECKNQAILTEAEVEVSVLRKRHALYCLWGQLKGILDAALSARSVHETGRLVEQINSIAAAKALAQLQGNQISEAYTSSHACQRVHCNAEGSPLHPIMLDHSSTAANGTKVTSQA